MQRNAFCKIFLPLATVVLFALWVFVLDPITNGWAIPCPWYEITGTLCPGCGLQRAACSLAHGDVVAAVGYNALSLLLLPLTAAAFVVWYLQRYFGKSERHFEIPAPLTYTMASMVILYWILRNIPASPVH